MLPFADQHYVDLPGVRYCLNFNAAHAETDRYDAHRCSIVQGLHMDILDIQDLHRVPGHYPETAIPSLDQKLQPKASKNAFYKTMVPHYNRLLQ